MKLGIVFVMLLALWPMAPAWAQATPQEAAELPDSPLLPARKAKSSEPLDTLLPAGEDPQNRLGAGFVRHLALDQKQFWTAPFHLNREDAKWLVPFAALTGGLIGVDSWLSRQVPGSANQGGAGSGAGNPSGSINIKRSQKISEYGAYSLAGSAATAYVWGHLVHNEHLRETGLLAGETALNSAATVYLAKAITERPRPLDGNGNGTFFQGGASFPSEHSAIAWSIASVVAHEYPGPLTQIAAYGLASTVSLTRVTGKQHFASDVIVGSALGWYWARQIYRAHHDPEAGGKGWGNFAGDSDAGARAAGGGENAGNPEHMGSPYLPLDSWVYAAIERLARLGYIRSAFIGLRPWSRLAAASMVSEAQDRLAGDEPAPAGTIALERELEQEFAFELGRLDGQPNRTAKIESVYGRVASIRGPPLNDSYHFGETIVNDFGRPFARGWNSYDGVSGYATAGPFALYVRGEYQHAPGATAYSADVQNTLAAVDEIPLQLSGPVPAANRLRLLDTYVAGSQAGWQVSFGKQSLWWGPGEGGSLMLGDNAEPIYMARASRIVPLTLPWIFRFLGPMRSEMFFGQLAGNRFPARPLLHGEKISFKPTENLELGFSRTAEFGGVGRPLTAAALFNSYIGFESSETYAANDNPGKRTGGFDFSYRVPFLRDWLTVYADSISADDPSPLAAPRRAAISPGLYAPRLPGLPELELRVEAVYTDTPTSRSHGGQFYYWDAIYYHQLYRNNNNLIGSWVGREGVGYQAWSRYSFRPKNLSRTNTLEFGFRHAQVAGDFIPRGVTLTDGSVKFECWLGHDLSASAFVQGERWLAPLLAPAAERNWTSTLQVTFWPKSRGR